MNSRKPGPYFQKILSTIEKLRELKKYSQRHFMESIYFQKIKPE